MTTADAHKLQRQSLWSGGVGSALGCFLVVFATRQQSEWALVVGAIVLGTAVEQWFSWVSFTMWLAKRAEGQAIKSAELDVPTRWFRALSVLAMQVGLCGTGVVLFVAGSVTHADRLAGAGAGIGIAGAVIFAGTLLVFRRRS